MPHDDCNNSQRKRYVIVSQLPKYTCVLSDEDDCLNNNCFGSNDGLSLDVIYNVSAMSTNRKGTPSLWHCQKCISCE